MSNGFYVPNSAIWKPTLPVYPCQELAQSSRKKNAAEDHYYTCPIAFLSNDFSLSSTYYFYNYLLHTFKQMIFVFILFFF